jgi:hypothetical protein
MAHSKYKLSINLNTLNHLGINLYSNVPAVVSEVVANSWDADATEVRIDINTKQKNIVISDNGVGMDLSDVNERYLNVGYRKRDDGITKTPIHHRRVMGRKGIGKLSLFSIADNVTVYSVKNTEGEVTKNGFILRTKDIKKAIAKNQDYYPVPIPESKIAITVGTSIVLTKLRKSVKTTDKFIRKRIARRFSVIGNEYDFCVKVNGKDIGVDDRDYFQKVQYIWTLGEKGKKYKNDCKNAVQFSHIDGNVDAIKKYSIWGWVGTFDKQKSITEGNNTIVILARGKLIHEDLLKDVKEGGVFSKYLIGEINADFLDLDEKDDIATSDRQSLQESDPRYELLKNYLQKEVLKTIQKKWLEWRRENGLKEALKNEKLNQWFEELNASQKKYAKKLFGTIGSLDISNEDDKREVYKHGIIAFQTLALRDNLSVLENIDTERQFDLFKSIISGADELEAFHYYEITKGRLNVINKFINIVPKSKEKIIQEYIFDHLWLLDSSWERASTDEFMEKTVSQVFKRISANLTDAEKRARIDIGYRTAAGKHIIIELKKYERKVKATELIEQIEKYQSGLRKCLNTKFPRDKGTIEAIVILGSPPTPEDSDKSNREMLAAKDIRYVTYDELILNARNSYRDYLKKQSEITKLTELLDSL